MALNQLNRSSGPVSFGYAELENNNAAQASILTDFASQTTPGIDKSGLSLKTELKSSPVDPNKPAASPTKRKIFFLHDAHNELKRRKKSIYCLPQRLKSTFF